MRKQSRSSCNPENEIEEMKKEAARLEQELSYQFRRWKELKTGTQKIVDPFYAEGSSMNMCRTQIIRIKEAIEANLSIDLYPDEYYEDTPEKYPLNYIANEETLIPSSKQRIAEVRQMPEYRALLDLHYENLFSKKEDEANHVFYYTVKNYVDHFARAITEAEKESEDEAIRKDQFLERQWLMEIRRCVRYSDDWWKSAFTRCRQQILALPQYAERLEQNKENMQKEENIKAQKKPNFSAAVFCPTQNNFEADHQFSLFDYGIA